MILFNNCSSSKGQKYAMMELKVIVASILLNFNIESTQRSEDLRHNPGMILQPNSGNQSQADVMSLSQLLYQSLDGVVVLTSAGW